MNLLSFAILSRAPSIGVIGGADGPTSILVSGSPLAWILPGLALVLLLVLLFLRILRKKA